MSELACFRSMSETLVAAVSSFVVFLAANWGTALLMGLHGDLLHNKWYQIFGHITSTFAMPLLAFLTSLLNGVLVYRVKKSQLVKSKKMDHRSITIITLCPIFIQFPTSALGEDELAKLQRLRGYESMTNEKQLEDMCPLELRPRRLDGDAKIDTNSATSAHVNEEGSTNSAHVNEEDFTQLMCLEVPDQADHLGERAVLLNLGLAPKYTELSYVRSRNRFQSVVTAVQAAGYMLTVIQRAVQHHGISPVEAFVTFLCIIVGLQLLIELYACGHYQRPLILRLNARQLHSLRDADVPDFGADPGRTSFLLMIFPCLLILGLSMYYFVYYVHAYLICSLSALLFFLAQLLSISILLLMRRRALDLIGGLVLITYYVMYASSMILAVVSTIVDWKAFQEANQKAWYAWILPHVSS